MKKAEMVKYFKERFKAEYDGGGVWFFTLKDDDDGYMHIRPVFGGPPANQNIGASAVMNPRWFIDVAEEVFGRMGGYMFTTGNGNNRIRPDEPLNETHLDAITQQTFDWFYECLSDEMMIPLLKRHYEIYERPGGWQFIHIVCCVVKGDVSKLQGYLDAFKKGDRMEFIPLIKQEFFEKAIPLAERYRSGELSAPIKF